eukprot:m.180801 g.180801  ORF g.180801 m.180801 type:complete len:186 (+) comp14656_c0_seq3:77-634(+)
MAEPLACKCCQKGNAFQQSLDELDFDRSLPGAASRGDIPKVRQLLSSGRCVNEASSSGYTALHYAARSNNVEMCQLLLAHGASVDATTNGQATPLMRAALSGATATLTLLLKSGASITCQDADGNTALHKAALQKQPETAAVLLDHIKTCGQDTIEAALSQTNNKSQTATQIGIKTLPAVFEAFA